MRLNETDKMLAGIYWPANTAYIAGIARRCQVPAQDIDDVVQMSAIFFLRRSSSSGELWLTNRILRLSALDAVRDYYNTKSKERRIDDELKKRIIEL